MIQPRIRTFSHHYRQRYGEPIGKLPLDLGILCPNRAKGGCIFCRPQSFTPTYLERTDSITRQIVRGKKQLNRNGFKKYLGYFQQETSTAAPSEVILPAINIVIQDPECAGIILSTRPDYVDDTLLEQVAAIITKSGKECSIELGIQTIHDRSLRFLNRNHSFSDCIDAIKRIQKKRTFEIGAHLIFGIPGESEEDMLKSVRTISSLRITGLKFHHLQVIEDTELHKLYQQGAIPLFTQEHYMELLLTILPITPACITIHRLWSSSHPKILVAPRWNILAAELSRTLLHRMEELDIFQGQDTLQPRYTPNPS